MNKIASFSLVILLLLMVQVNGFSQVKKASKNPIIPGYFADPSILHENGKYYLYATIDPWGGDSLAFFVSSDLEQWKRQPLNWPTKAACKSPTSNDSRVWAPSVKKGRDGKYHLFVSVGSEVYAGVADAPEGPWRNVHADGSPFIATQKAQGLHTIDAEIFLDEDGKAYLYWGSGWNWVNGHCLVVALNESMDAMLNEPKEITPPNYFEGPYMLKRNGTYFLMYSDGKCTDSTYTVRYASSSSPYGPWKEGANSPVLSTNAAKHVIGPGHHTVLQMGNQYFILYHRIAAASGKDLLRELCIDPLLFDKQGNMLKVQPTE